MAESEFSQEAGPNSEQYASYGQMNVDKRSFQFTSSKTPEEQYKGYLKLVKQFEEEIKNRDPKFEEIFEGLHYFITRTINNPRNLKEKLQEAGFSDSYYNRVKGLKEKYAMDIMENDLAFSAQKIHGFLLAEVTYRFLMHVNPFLDDGLDNVALNKIINEEVVEPIVHIISQDNVLNITSYDILCMVYYLTGNCHINWN